MNLGFGARFLLAMIFCGTFGIGCAARHTAAGSRDSVTDQPACRAAATSSLPQGGGEQSGNPGGQSGRSSVWTQGIPGAVVSVVAALFSFYFFNENRKLSRQIADRTVSFEAHKLLVEINKQFVADPSLFTIYDDNLENRKALANDRALKAKVEALGYMKLNVFEIVFARLPDDVRKKGWNGYFLDSMDRCSVLAEELRISGSIYHPELIRAYQEWLRDTGGKERRAAERARLHSETSAAWVHDAREKSKPD